MHNYIEEDEEEIIRPLSTYSNIELFDYIESTIENYKYREDPEEKKHLRKLYREAVDIYNRNINFESYNRNYLNK